MSILYYVLLTLFVSVCLFMILLVLIQKGRGGGLASAFGGGSGHTAFGSKTGDVLTWATSIVFGVFLVLAILLNLAANRMHGRTNPSTVSTQTPAAQPTIPDPTPNVPPAFPNVPPAMPEALPPLPGDPLVPAPDAQPPATPSPATPPPAIDAPPPATQPGQ